MDSYCLGYLGLNTMILLRDLLKQKISETLFKVPAWLAVRKSRCSPEVYHVFHFQLEKDSS